MIDNLRSVQCTSWLVISGVHIYHDRIEQRQWSREQLQGGLQVITIEYETKKILKNYKTLQKLNLTKDETSFQSFFAIYVKFYVTEAKMSHWWLSIYNWSK